MENKKPLFGMTMGQLREAAAGLGLPKFAAAQIADWLYKKSIASIGQMSNLSKKARELLDAAYTLGLEPPVKVSESADGTKKYLYKAGEGRFVEAAYIPDRDRATLCVSCQAGCKMGCRFCNTGLQGFGGNLSASQILNQIKSLPELGSLTNIVFMGMGEPMDNLEPVMQALEILTASYGFAMSPHRITLSTVGITPAMGEFLEKTDVHLAISVHNPFSDERAQIMPIERAHPLAKALALAKSHDFRHQRRFSAEYIMIHGVNDTPAHARELARILQGIPSRVNLIRCHEHPGSDFKPSPEIRMHEFQEILSSRGIIATIRASRGEDIGAACGLLSTKEMQERKFSGC